MCFKIKLRFRIITKRCLKAFILSTSRGTSEPPYILQSSWTARLRPSVLVFTSSRRFKCTSSSYAKVLYFVVVEFTTTSCHKSFQSKLPVLFLQFGSLKERLKTHERIINKSMIINY